MAAPLCLYRFMPPQGNSSPLHRLHYNDHVPSPLAAPTFLCRKGTDPFGKGGLKGGIHGYRRRQEKVKDICLALLPDSLASNEPAAFIDAPPPLNSLTLLRLFRYSPAMHEIIATYGYPALFLLSFLAATLIPLGSEWLLVAMLVQRHDPVATVAVATVGNYLGACTSYAIGIYGGNFLIGKVLRISSPERERAEHFFARYGSWSLLLSWLPVIGDPLCLAGGLLKISFVRFSALVAAGKLARYAAVAWLTLGTQTVAA